MKELSRLGYLPGFNFSNFSVCEHCLYGKQMHSPHKRGSSRKSEPLQSVHSDVCGPMPMLSMGGVAYFVTFINDFSLKVWVYHLKRKDEVLSVLKNFTKWVGITIKEVPYSAETGELDLEALKSELNENTAGVYIENPNFFGVFEKSVTELKELIGKAMLVVGIDPISLGAVKPPGEYGADIVIGELQSLGNPLNFGGPMNGLFACKKEYIRKMPGRIIGLTQDTHGRQAFCMTLQTREQYIRREIATSNICTNEALCALASGIHLAALGKNGLLDLCKQNLARGQYLAAQLSKINGVRSPLFNNQHFNEFVIQVDGSADEILKKLLAHGILGGVPLKKHFPDLGEAILVATTEVHSDDDYARFTNMLQQMLGASAGGGQ